MAPTVYEDVDTLLGGGGRDLGATGWQVVDPWQVAVFAAATGGPVPPPDAPAPPLMVLALTNLFLPGLLEVRGARGGINYGTGSVRFGAAVHPGDRVRGRATLVAATEVTGGVQTAIEIRVEVEGQPEPACVAESLSRWMR